MNWISSSNHANSDQPEDAMTNKRGKPLVRVFKAREF